ncbi:MAG: hypothetical protein SWE60_20710 [Thermodesulfobacteriota bacterium]|nr:hypothetical protein [Thermodesulfobacteriota bacterium]
MAEIKSTLDIIMEKTKHLTLSDGEKEALQQKELAQEAKGLVQKFLDGLMNTRTVTAALESHHQDRGLLKDLLRKEAMERVAPEADNDRVLAFLEEVLAVESGPLQKALAAFHEKIEQESVTRLKKLQQALERQGITGSALLPNLAHDPTWGPFYEAAKRAFKEGLGPM